MALNMSTVICVITSLIITQSVAIPSPHSTDVRDSVYIGDSIPCVITDDDLVLDMEIPLDWNKLIDDKCFTPKDMERIKSYITEKFLNHLTGLNSDVEITSRLGARRQRFIFTGTAAATIMLGAGLYGAIMSTWNRYSISDAEKDYSLIKTDLHNIHAAEHVNHWALEKLLNTSLVQLSDELDKLKVQSICNSDQSYPWINNDTESTLHASGLMKIMSDIMDDNMVNVINDLHPYITDLLEHSHPHLHLPRFIYHRVASTSQVENMKLTKENLVITVSTQHIDTCPFIVHHWGSVNYADDLTGCPRLRTGGRLLTKNESHYGTISSSYHDTVTNLIMLTRPVSRSAFKMAGFTDSIESLISYMLLHDQIEVSKCGVVTLDSNRHTLMIGPSLKIVPTMCTTGNNVTVPLVLDALKSPKRIIVDQCVDIIHGSDYLKVQGKYILTRHNQTGGNMSLTIQDELNEYEQTYVNVIEPVDIEIYKWHISGLTCVIIIIGVVIVYICLKTIKRNMRRKAIREAIELRNTP